MFTVKATYREETRKIIFNSSSAFPSYGHLAHQLYRVFPISHDYVLSKLLFSPDSNKPTARILVSTEVRNADEYQRAIAPLQGHAYSGPLLKFTVFDEIPHKVPMSSSGKAPQLPRRLSELPSSWTPSFMSARPASGFNWDPNMFNSPASAIPPPPIIFSTPPVNLDSPLSLQGPSSVCIPQQQLSMNTDCGPFPSMVGSHQSSPAQDQENFWTRGSLTPPQPFGGAQRLPRHPQQPQDVRTLSRSSSCCSVFQGKADIDALLTTFKADLDLIMSNSFGPSLGGNLASPLLSNSQPTIPAVPGAWPETLPSRAMETINIPGFVPTLSVTPAVQPCIHTWCIVCSKPFGGPWYSCDKCSWHVLCPSCVDAGGQEHRRNLGEGHTMIKRTYSGCPPEPDQPRAAPTPAFDPVPAPVAATDRETTPTLVVHKGVVCDMCENTIVGVRHKCLDCPDYDLCTSCINTGSTKQHNPFHEFFEIEEAGHVVVHTVFSGDGEKECAWTARRTIQNSAPRVVSRARTEPAEPVTHSATCDLCESKIRGTRYKCVNCIDFDTCSSCFTITPEQHPHHGFVRIHNTEDLIMRDGLAANTRHYATCNVCKKIIYGIRYKCMHPDCPDFDLCAMCEGLPIPVHPSRHPMLKMKTVDTVIPTVYRVGQTTLIKRQGSVKLTGAQEVEKALPTPPILSDFDNEEQWAEASSTKEAVFREASSIMASSTAGFTLPPLALDPRSDLFREFWPKVTQELKQTQDGDVDSERQDIQQPIPMQPLVNGASVQASVESVANPFRDPKPECAFVYSPELSAQALLSRPVSVPSVPDMVQQTIAPVTHIRSLSVLLNGYRSPSPNYRSPSPNFASSLEASMSSLYGTTQNETTLLVPSSPAKGVVFPLVASFLSDTTVPDGQIFPPGAEFVKSWHMINDGPRDWPETTELHFTSGEKFCPNSNVCQKAKVGKVASGSEVDVWTGELKAPEISGRYRGYWRLSDGEDSYFGHGLWVDIIVAEPSHQSDRSEGSLASSSRIMMPQSAASARSTGPSELMGTQRNQDPSPTAVSKLSMDDAASDGGSIGSSVSLISVPSSEDDDAEDWQDSRSHVVTSPPETSRDTAEYIVLFEDTSSDEE